MRHFEGVVPEGAFAGTQLLGLLPLVDAILFARAARYSFMDDLGWPRQVGVALRRIGHDHLVAVGAVLEEVIDPFFFHEAAREVEVRLAVLHAKVAGLEAALQLKNGVDSLQHLLQDVGNGDVLKNAALRPLAQQPELGHDIHPVSSKNVVPLALRDAAANAVEMTLLSVWKRQMNRHLLAQKLVKGNFGAVLSEQVELEVEQMGEGLGAGKPHQE